MYFNTANISSHICCSITLKQTLDYVSGLHNFQEILPIPQVFRCGCVNTEKVLYYFYQYFSRIRSELKRHNRVYALSSKHIHLSVNESLRSISVILQGKLRLADYGVKTCTDRGAGPCQ